MGDSQVKIKVVSISDPTDESWSTLIEQPFEWPYYSKKFDVDEITQSKQRSGDYVVTEVWILPGD